MAVDKDTVAQIAHLARIRITEAEGEALTGELSNILDWLPREAATATLASAARALRPGGYVVIRQLNSALDIRGASDASLLNGRAPQRNSGGWFGSKDRSYRRSSSSASVNSICSPEALV